MLRLLLVALLVPLGFIPPQKPTPQPDAQPYRDPEAYQIYSSILPERWPVAVAHTNKLIIRAETVPPFNMCLKPEGESVPVLAPVIAAFVEANEKKWLLQEMFTMNLPYEFVSSKDLEDIFQTGPEGWKPFYQRYPDSGGFNEMSAVGFNSEKTIAIVYMSHSCGGLCGGGGFYVLEKRDGKWQEMKWQGSTCTWVS